MLDLQRCIFTRVDEAKVATGSTVSAEGRCLVSALGTDGEEYVTESAGLAATEQFAGMSYNTNLTATKFPNVETGTIPAAVAYTIQLVKTYITTDEIRIVASTTGALTNVGVGVPANGEFGINYTTGLVTFNVAQASETVVMSYQYAPTTLEATTRWFQAGINANSGGDFNQIGVIKAPCIIYTSEYDASVDWTGITIAAPAKTGVGGRLEANAGSGAVLPWARIIHIPDTDNVFLGVEFLAL